MKMSSSANIVIIDPNPHLLSKMSDKTKQLGFTTRCFIDPNTSIQHIVNSFPRLALLGPSLDKDAYLKCVNKLKAMDLTLPILKASAIDNHLEICTNSSLEDFDVIPSGLQWEDFTRAIIKVSNRKKDKKIRSDFPLMIGKSEAFGDIWEKVRTIADKNITVLVTGESGTGKDIIALYLHQLSSRSERLLVRINCAALPDGLLESEVFGFQKGAFTDAIQDKPGRIEMAHKGTLFLDEIGDLTLPLQAKILHILENKDFSRLGDIRDKSIDARIILATNQDLKEKVRQGSFRKDLYHRLNVLNIAVPPLRERKGDIDLLVDYFKHKFAYELNRSVIVLPASVMKHFQKYHWPGNIRELENVIRKIVLFENADFVFDELQIINGTTKAAMATDSYSNEDMMPCSDEKINDLFNENSFSLKKITKAYVSEIERHEILKALRATKWNRKKSAELLAVSYKKLLNRISEFKLEE
jgi:two-component system response regulator AtoC